MQQSPQRQQPAPRPQEQELLPQQLEGEQERQHSRPPPAQPGRQQALRRPPQRQEQQGSGRSGWGSLSGRFSCRPGISPPAPPAAAERPGAAAAAAAAAALVGRRGSWTGCARRAAPGCRIPPAGTWLAQCTRLYAAGRPRSGSSAMDPCTLNGPPCRRARSEGATGDSADAAPPPFLACSLACSIALYLLLPILVSIPLPPSVPPSSPPTPLPLPSRMKNTRARIHPAISLSLTHTHSLSLSLSLTHSLSTSSPPHFPRLHPFFPRLIDQLNSFPAPS